MPIGQATQWRSWAAPNANQPRRIAPAARRNGSSQRWPRRGSGIGGSDLELTHHRPSGGLERVDQSLAGLWAVSPRYPARPSALAGAPVTSAVGLVMAGICGRLGEKQTERDGGRPASDRRGRIRRQFQAPLHSGSPGAAEVPTMAVRLPHALGTRHGNAATCSGLDRHPDSGLGTPIAPGRPR